MSCTTCGGTPQIAVDNFGDGITHGTYRDENGNLIEDPNSISGWFDEILKPGCNICVRCLLFWSGVGLLAILVLGKLARK